MRSTGAARPRRRNGAALAALVFFLVISSGPGADRDAPSAAAWASEEAEWNGLPAGAGREEVFGLCSACHSLMIVKQQGLDRGSWAETLDWMIEEQGMPELDEDTLALLLDYLTAHYGIERTQN